MQMIMNELFNMSGLEQREWFWGKRPATFSFKHFTETFFVSHNLCIVLVHILAI